MKAGDRVVVRAVSDSILRGPGTIIAVRTQRSETGYLVLIDGEERSSYFGPQRVLPLSEESSKHIAGAE